MLSCNRIRNAFCAAALLVCSVLSGQVKPGVEVLRDRGFSGLEGLRVGLVTNPSGVDRELKSTIDILFDAPEVTLVALFAPEHGVRGDVYAGEKVQTDRDSLDTRHFVAAIITQEGKAALTQAERDRLHDWLQSRVGADSLVLY